MALVVKDRVQETGTANTTVSFTLTGAMTSFQSFSAIGDTNTTYYIATDGTNWEVGIGTYSTTGPTLTRTTILASSNSGSAVSTFGASIVITGAYPAGVAAYISNNSSQTSGQVLTSTGTTTAPNWQTPINSYTVMGGATKFSPAHSLTYYFGSFSDFLAPSTTAALGRLYIPKAGTIKAVTSMILITNVVGSSENVATSIVINNTTTVSLGNQTYNSTVNTVSAVNFTGLSQAVAAGDYLQMKIVCPAWVTNPTNMYWQFIVYIE